MTAKEWIRDFETYLTIVKNRSLNTVKSYVSDAELLYRFVTTGKLSQPRVKTPLVDASAIPALLVEGDNRAGLGYVTAQGHCRCGDQYGFYRSPGGREKIFSGFWI
jgi:hypothetical protein